jgi:hypothetical protein
MRDDDEWWRECRDPRPMLQHLGVGVSARKKRLLLAACVRRVWPLLPAGPLRNAVEMSESFADGLVGSAKLAGARAAAVTAAHAAGDALRPGSQRGVGPDELERRAMEHAAAEAVVAALTPNAPMGGVFAAARAAARQALAARGERVPPDLPASSPLVVEALAGLCAVIRDVLGNPYRPVAFRRSWSDAHGGVAVSLARAAYDERSFDRLPILADALEDGGCDSADLLGHLRGGGEHWRGCWALDLVLGL